MKRAVPIFLALTGCVGPHQQAKLVNAPSAPSPAPAMEERFTVDGEPGPATRDGRALS